MSNSSKSRFSDSFQSTRGTGSAKSAPKKRDKEHIIPAAFQEKRLGQLINILVFAMGLLIIKAIFLQVGSKKQYDKKRSQQTATIVNRGQRGSIVDRNGQVFAHNIRRYNLSADPSRLKDKEKEEMIKKLPQIFNDLNPKILRKRLYRKKSRYALIKQNASTEEKQKVESQIKGRVHVSKSMQRIYPKKSLAGPLLGFVEVVEDPTRPGGRSGIERAYENTLKGQKYTIIHERDGRQKVFAGEMLFNDKNARSMSERKRGKSVRLTIDMRIQQLAEDYLSDQVNEMEARSGVAVVMDPYNGDVLALAQVPSYDPNEYFNYNYSFHQNQAVSHPIEPGSTIKPFLIASALNEKLITPETKFPGYDGRFKLGIHVIRDSHGVKELNTLEIIKFSSNVGAIQVAQIL